MQRAPKEHHQDLMWGPALAMFVSNLGLWALNFIVKERFGTANIYIYIHITYIYI